MKQKMKEEKITKHKQLNQMVVFGRKLLVNSDEIQTYLITSSINNNNNGHVR